MERMKTSTNHYRDSPLMTADLPTAEYLSVPAEIALTPSRMRVRIKHYWYFDSVFTRKLVRSLDAYFQIS